MPRPKGLPKTGGKQKGYKAPETLSKEKAREAVRQAVMKHMDRMLRAQVANAIGIGHLYTRDNTGKFTRIVDTEKVDELLAKGREGVDFWIFTKDPNVQAFVHLMDRALDKPKEQEQDINVKVTDDARVQRLLAGRKRAASK